MLRRNPTRIELKLEDITEYTDLRDRDNEMKKEKEKANTLAAGTAGAKSKQEVQDRIGYVPHPRPNN